MDPNIVVTKTPSLGNSSSMAPAAASSTPSMPSSTPSSNLSTGRSMNPGINTKSTDWGKIGMYTVGIIVLTILGFNIFKYLGNATENLSNIFAPITAFFGSGITKTVKNTIDTSAEGTKGIIDTTTSVLDSGLSTLENKLNSNITRNKIDDKKKDREDSSVKDKNNKQYEGKAHEPKHKEPVKKGPEPDDAGSKTQSKASKTGFCYIGEDRGFRSCIRVNQGDTCMSGDIFPTKDLCINPNLRE